MSYLDKCRSPFSLLSLRSSSLPSSFSAPLSLASFLLPSFLPLSSLLFFLSLPSSLPPAFFPSFFLLSLLLVISDITLSLCDSIGVWVLHIDNSYVPNWASLIVQLVKNLPIMQQTPVKFLGWEDPLEKE